MARTAKGEGCAPYPYRAGYRAYITVKGKRQYYYFPDMTKRQAAAKLRTLLGQRDDGTLPRGKDYTVALWVRHWLKTATLKPGVRKNYEHNVEHYIIPELGTIKLRELEPEHLEQMYDRMLTGKLSAARKVDGRKVKKPLRPNTIVNVHSNIRRALTVAMQRGHVGRNVAHLVEPPSVKKEEMKTLSTADAHAILELAKVDRYAARWFLGLVFGIRPAEVLGLTWPEVDLRHGVVKIRRQLQRIRGEGMQMIDSAKTDAGWRDIAVPDAVIGMLKATRAQQMRDRVEHGEKYVEWEFAGQPVALVFTQPNGRPIDIGVDTRAWRKLLDAAGLPHERRYIGRHTAASVMIDMGMDVAVVAAILGHKRTSFTMDTYVHPMADKKREAADQLGALYV